MKKEMTTLKEQVEKLPKTALQKNFNYLFFLLETMDKRLQNLERWNT